MNLPRLDEPGRRVAWPPRDVRDPDSVATREWLVTNGLGGYASGTVSGVDTRRYHGLLIAALPPGRIVMLNHLAQHVRSANGRVDEINAYLAEFRLEAGLPVWRYELRGSVIEKRLFLPHMQNTVQIVYELVQGQHVELLLRPSVNFRPQESPVSEPLGSPYEFRAVDGLYEIVLAGSPLPTLRMQVLSTPNATFTLETGRTENVLYPVEESRGYQARGVLWSPGSFTIPLEPNRPIALAASTESVERMSVLPPDLAFDAERIRRQKLIVLAPPEARSGPAVELVLAADQFIIKPAGRLEESVRAHAFGDEVRTVIAGYHWFTDWGRDTMISLEGLTLTTGRHTEAGYILRTFAHYVRRGLIPNMFPEGRKEGLYHTADATLWFFHAMSRYVDVTGDRLTLALLYPKLKTIVDAHVHGTDFGIHVDERDGLLVQGAPGYQLTWMDAKVDDWVVTPRRGKAVEINALWFNALKLMEQWAAQFGDPVSSEYGERADRVGRSFNDRFWYAEGGYLHDVVDPNESKLRPNQVFAISLTHPVLARERWEPVMQAVRAHLVTPVGLRTLAPGDPDYKAKYFGDLRARDAAYHQGTVWAWLVGPFVDAWLRVYPDDVEGARKTLSGFLPHLDEACIGSVSEVFDAEAPFTPRGCIAQAWSVAEVLRGWVKLEQRSAERASRTEPVASALR